MEGAVAPGAGVEVESEVMEGENVGGRGRGRGRGREGERGGRVGVVVGGGIMMTAGRGRRTIEKEEGREERMEDHGRGTRWRGREAGAEAGRWEGGTGTERGIDFVEIEQGRGEM